MNYVKGLAALAMTAVLAGCHKFDTIEQYRVSEEEALANAELALGFEIDPNQSWSMTSNATANVGIDVDYGETYNVKIFSNDPLVDGVGYVLAQGEIENGKTFNADFTYPSGKKSLMVGVTNSHGYSFYRTAPVVNGKLDLQIGAATANAPRRSMAAPEVPDITVTAEYAASFLEGAKEPTDENVVDDHNGSYWVDGTDGHWVIDQEASHTNATLPGFGWQNAAGNYFLGWNPGQVSQPDKEWFDANCRSFAETSAPDWNASDAVKNAYIDAFWEVYNKLQNTNRSNWMNVWTWPVKAQDVAEVKHWEEATEGYWVYDETFVTKYKITGTWSKNIDKLGSNSRTVYVSGTWNIPNGSGTGENPINIAQANAGSVIVVANGGTINIPKNAELILANQARLVVMPGGTVQGEGTLHVTNGNGDGLENYNGGTINVGKFNNNYGKFYNYNSFKCVQYIAGAGESNFYNHGVAHITNGGTDKNAYLTPNARIFNACQWYCEDDMRAYIVEMTAGSYFYVGGQLQMSAGTDGTNDPSYVAMAAGALMRVGDLSNNNTSWVGPTTGYAVVETGGVSYLNWTGSEPITDGYFINNIAVSVDDKTVGASQGQGTDTYVALRDFILNGYGSTGNVFDPIGKTGTGNGGAVLVEKGGANLKIDASEGFVAGQKGCTPGYDGDPSEEKTENPIYSYAFEDTKLGDYDLNDVVIKVQENTDGDHLDLKVVASGATLNLNIRLYPATTVPKGVVAVYPEKEEGFEVLKYTRDGVECDEVHAMLGVDPGTMVNTGWGNNKAQPITIQILKGDYDPAHLPLAIYSVAQGEVRLSGSGTAPYGVVIPMNWSWPYETRKVHNIYNATQTAKDGDQSFKTFAEEQGQAESWYDHPTGDVLNEKTLGY